MSSYSFLAGLLLCMKQAKRYGLTEDPVLDLVLWAVPCCILGSRIYYVIFYLDLYRDASGALDWSRIIAIWDGGIAIYGPVIAGALSVRKVCVRLLGPMQKTKRPRRLSSASRAGQRWSYCSAEADARSTGERYLAVDGMDSVISILAAIEDDRVPDVGFVELCACTQGCVGGCLTVEDPFVATMRLRHLIRELPDTVCDFDAEVGDPAAIQADKELEFAPVYLLDEDRTVAMEKMAAIHELERQLPGLLCGSCGAPSCHAFAEDVIMGRAKLEDCIFQVRAKMRAMMGPEDPDEYLPAPFRSKRNKVVPSER